MSRSSHRFPGSETGVEGEKPFHRSAGDSDAGNGTGAEGFCGQIFQTSSRPVKDQEF
jgi:hypothetical protein